MLLPRPSPSGPRFPALRSRRRLRPSCPSRPLPFPSSCQRDPGWSVPISPWCALCPLPSRPRLSAPPPALYPPRPASSPGCRGPDRPRRLSYPPPPWPGSYPRRPSGHCPRSSALRSRLPPRHFWRYQAPRTLRPAAGLHPGRPVSWPYRPGQTLPASGPHPPEPPHGTDPPHPPVSGHLRPSGLPLPGWSSGTLSSPGPSGSPLPRPSGLLPPAPAGGLLPPRPSAPLPLPLRPARLRLPAPLLPPVPRRPVPPPAVRLPPLPDAAPPRRPPVLSRPLLPGRVPPLPPVQLLLPVPVRYWHSSHRLPLPPSSERPQPPRSRLPLSESSLIFFSASDNLLPPQQGFDKALPDRPAPCRQTIRIVIQSVIIRLLFYPPLKYVNIPCSVPSRLPFSSGSISLIFSLFNGSLYQNRTGCAAFTVRSNCPTPEEKPQAAFSPAALRFLSCIASCRPSSRTHLPARGYAREPNDLLRGKSAPVIEKGGAFQVVTAQIPTAKNMAATARKKAIICSAFFP